MKHIDNFKNFKIFETGEWASGVDLKYSLKNPHESEFTEQIIYMYNILKDIKNYLDKSIKFKIIDVRGFDSYQGAYGIFELEGKKFNLWGTEYQDVYWIEDFPVDNTSKKDLRPGFEGDIMDIVGVINNYILVKKYIKDSLDDLKLWDMEYDGEVVGEDVFSLRIHGRGHLFDIGIVLKLLKKIDSKKLVKLHIFSDDIKIKTYPVDLTFLDNLVELSLNDGAGEHLIKLPNTLKFLSLQNNVYENFPNCLYDLKKLETLNVQGSNLRKYFLKDLEKLNIKGNIEILT